MNIRKSDKEGLFKSIFTAYFILLLHVFLLAGVGLSVVLFKGVYHYLPYIMAGLAILVLTVAWIVYRRMREHSTDLRQILSAPEFQDRTVEVKLLGGLATFKIKARKTHIFFWITPQVFTMAIPPSLKLPLARQNKKCGNLPPFMNET